MHNRGNATENGMPAKNQDLHGMVPDESPVALPTSIPAFLTNVIFDCLSRDPDLRPTPVEILLRLERGMPTLAPEGLATWS